MQDPRTPQDSEHVTLSDYRAAGYEPADHPAAGFLGEAAGHDRWIARDIILANARRDLPPDEDEIGDVMTSISRWVIELMEDDELADWFLDGLGEETIEREERYAVEAWDVNRRPWAAEVVIEPEPYQCGISGRAGSLLAVRLTHRLDPGVEPILMHPAEALGVIERGLHALDDALDLTEPMDEARQRRILARCLAAYRTTDPLIPANENPTGS